MPNPLVNARIISESTLPSDYMSQAAKRGEIGFEMSRSELCDFAPCPARWRAGYREGASTSSQEWGSLLDCVVLTPEQFESRYAIVPSEYQNEKGEIKPWNFNANACKNWRAANDGKDEVKSDALKDAHDAKAVLLGDPDIRDLLTDSARQVFVRADYEDRDTGLVIPVKCLIDIVPSPTGNNASSLADLKTASFAGHEHWKRECVKYGYDLQAAMCIDMFSLASGRHITDFLHVVQESFPPWQVAHPYFSGDWLNLARSKYIAILARYAQCLKTNVWPGYDTGWTSMNLEEWMMR